MAEEQECIVVLSEFVFQTSVKKYLWLLGILLQTLKYFSKNNNVHERS